MQENLEAFRVYMAVRNQHIVGFDGPIDLDLNALFCIMKAFGVNDQEECYLRVHNTYKSIMADIKENKNYD